MSLLEQLAGKAQGTPRKIVFPEGTDATIIEAACKIKQEGLGEPILLCVPDAILDDAVSGSKVDVADIETVEVGGDLLAQFIADYVEATGFPEAVAESFFTQPLFFAAMMVKHGIADAMVAGIAHATEDVIMASEMVIGLADGVETPSSFFLMDVPGWEGSEGSLLVFADCAVNPNPTSLQLADIALVTAESARVMFGFDPRVALLSFSTKGSADHADVQKVTCAVELLRERNVDFAFDGELQADAAIIAAVAAKKVPSASIASAEHGAANPSEVAGKANILVFPDLDAGNIAYKLVQRLAKAAAYGPVLQGFAKPVSDLSRGATVDDVVGAAVMAAVQVRD